MLPQTPEGWVARLVDFCSFHGIGISVRKIIWLASGAKLEGYKKFHAKVQADPIKRAKKLKLQRESHWRNRDAANTRSRKRYADNPTDYSIKHRFWYYIGGGKERLAEKNRLKQKNSDSPIERAKAQARVRDGDTCQWSGCNFKRDHVHHILSVAEFPEHADKLWNLICYCRNHHAAFHAAKGESNVAAFIRSGRMRYYEVKIGHVLFFHQLMGIFYGWR